VKLPFYFLVEKSNRLHQVDASLDILERLLGERWSGNSPAKAAEFDGCTAIAVASIIVQ
jgi:hypothetical protein